MLVLQTGINGDFTESHTPISRPPDAIAVLANTARMNSVFVLLQQKR